MAEMDPRIAGVAQELQHRLDTLPGGMDQRQAFLALYLRTTQAIGREVAAGTFEDPVWVAYWDEVFAGLFLTAHDADLAGEPVVRPWQLAFEAAPGYSDLVHILLALNAHINYDLPQAMVAVISPGDFCDSAVLERRRGDHERIDTVIGARVAAEDPEARAGRPVRWRHRLLAPLNRWSSRRFLRRSRRDVWLNVADLHRAREQGSQAYAERLAELESLSAAKITDLLRPGPLLLRLALRGFGVRLSER